MIRLETPIELIELFEPILLLKLGKQLPVERFEAAVSQSTGPTPLAPRSEDHQRLRHDQERAGDRLHARRAHRGARAAQGALIGWSKNIIVIYIYREREMYVYLYISLPIHMYIYI